MKKKRQQGFLFLDNLMAILLISLALVAMAGMFTVNSKGIRQSDDQSIAYTLGQERLEQLKTKLQSSPDQTITAIDNDTAVMWKLLVPEATSQYTDCELLLNNITAKAVAAAYTGRGEITLERLKAILHDANTRKDISNASTNNLTQTKTFYRITEMKINTYNPRLIQVKVTIRWQNMNAQFQQIEVINYYERAL